MFVAKASKAKMLTVKIPRTINWATCHKGTNNKISNPILLINLTIST